MSPYSRLLLHALLADMASYQLAAQKEFLRIERETCLKRSFAAWWAHASGQLETLRRLKRDEGQPAWRILRYQHIAHPELAGIPLLRTSYTRPTAFRAHLRFFKKNCHVVSLEHLVRNITDKKKIPERTVVITIDGGYHNFYQHAYPLLRKFGLPATVSIPTAFIGSKYLPWDQVTLNMLYLLMGHGCTFPRFDFFDEAFIRDVDTVSVADELNHANILLLIDKLRSIERKERIVTMGVLEKLVEQVGGLAEQELYMDWEQLREITRANIQVVSSGHYLNSAPELSSQDLLADIKLSLLTLQQQNIDPLPLYCFPDGDTTKEARQMLKSIGIDYTLGLGEYSMGAVEDSAALLSRIDIYHYAAPSAAQLACRLWDLRPGGFRF